MKIISKFKDYYDSVQQYGRDESILYLRNEEYFQPDKSGYVKERFHPSDYPQPNQIWVGNRTQQLQGELSTHGFAILFCGKYYRGLKMEIGGSWSNNNSIQFCYSTESAMAFLTKHNIPTSYTFRKEIITPGVNEKSLERYFSEKVEVSKPDMNQIHKCPVILSAVLGAYRDSYSVRDQSKNASVHVVKNPCLRDLEFYRVMDANTAYQELSMFLGGVMASNGPSMVEVSEKTRIEKRGFDKWSFRKMPTKKKTM